MMQKIKQGYAQVLGGVLGLLVVAPAVFLVIAILVLYGKYIVQMIRWLWAL